MKQKDKEEFNKLIEKEINKTWIIGMIMMFIFGMAFSMILFIGALR